MKKSFFFIIFVALMITVAGCKENSVAPVTETTPPPSETSVWDSFALPAISFENEDIAGNGKYFSIYLANPDSVEKAISIKVCKLLYKQPSEVVKVSRVKVTLRDEGGVAYTTSLGAATEKNMVISGQYFKGLIDGGMSKAAITNEIVGVMTHESTHIFQSDNNYGEKNGWSAIEGIADCVRYLAGVDKITRRHPGGTWLDGYTTTGFFIAWLQEKKDPDFLYNFNKYVGQHKTDFTWEAATWKLLNKSVTDLWSEYQSAISGN